MAAPFIAVVATGPGPHVPASAAEDAGDGRVQFILLSWKPLLNQIFLAIDCNGNAKCSKVIAQTRSA